MILLKDCKCILCDNKATVTGTNTWNTHKCEKCATHYRAINYDISCMQTSITYVDQIKEIYEGYVAVYDGKELKFYSYFTESEPNTKLVYSRNPSVKSIQAITYPGPSFQINDVKELKRIINKYRKNPKTLKILLGFM